ncbi:MAG: hypothetical protein QOI89_40 [Solirubrobacteraceae bacterium]|jgi:hypothetical protein|nr:hypothetical protein [Solirubrobacteraceae bacterium]
MTRREPRFVGGACPDPTHCEHRWRHATGPWSCAYNHPRQGSRQAVDSTSQIKWGRDVSAPGPVTHRRQVP